MLIVNDTRIDRHHGCTSVMNAIQLLLARHGMISHSFWPAHADWRSSSSFATALANARLVIVNGEGTIHHDRPSGALLLDIGAAARAAGVPASLINTGWEANGPSLLARLHDFALVAARDTASAEAMRQSGCAVRIVPDLSLLTPPENDLAQRSGIGFTDNVDRLQALALERSRSAMGGRTQSIVYSRQGVTGYLSFLRDVLSLREDVGAPRDLMRLLVMRDRLHRASSRDWRTFLADLGRLELLVSGRFHACTLALLMGTPFVARRSNTGKIANLVDDAGLASWRKDISLEPADISRAAQQGWSVQEVKARRDYIGHAHSSADTLFADLRRLAA